MPGNSALPHRRSMLVDISHDGLKLDYEVDDDQMSSDDDDNDDDNDVTDGIKLVKINEDEVTNSKKNKAQTTMSNDLFSIPVQPKQSSKRTGSFLGLSGSKELSDFNF